MTKGGKELNIAEALDDIEDLIPTKKEKEEKMFSKDTDYDEIMD